MFPSVVKVRRMWRYLEEWSDGQFLAIAGSYGNIYVLCAKSFEWLDTLKGEGQVNCPSFDPANPRLLFSHGDLGQVSVWEVAERQLWSRFADDGCVSGTATDVSPIDGSIACGSNSGVVNVYDRGGLRDSTPKAKKRKSLFQLTNRVDVMRFFKSDMLAFASSCRPKALRICHLASATVFSNFPPTEFPAENCRPREGWLVGAVRCCDFSPNGAFFAFGNEQGYNAW